MDVLKKLVEFFHVIALILLRPREIPSLIHPESIDSGDQNSCELHPDTTQKSHKYFTPGTPPLSERFRSMPATSGGSWKMENICREILEELYELPFPSIKAEFLRNPETGSFLELDCANLDINVALEYNGRQHYAYPNRWHKSKSDFREQVRRDRFKERMCKKVGLFLIIVPYTIAGRESIKEFILSRIDKDRALRN